ncbi:hypothetical protein ONZ45_g6525 [Pleurotus djamor]|nr:hypothetical protein ONZ45_g6525 [Pleurotus djamor]
MGRKRKNTASAAENTQDTAISPPPSKKPAKAAIVVPQIPWTNDNDALIWALVTLVEKPENFRVVVGKRSKERIDGEGKIHACRRMGKELVPELYAISATVIGERIKGKVTWLLNKYKEHASKLRVTGGGIGEDDESSQTQEPLQTHLQFYIPPDGPTNDTPTEGKNLWAEIVKAFPFFPRLHALLATRPNVVPPARVNQPPPSADPELHEYARPSTPLDWPSTPRAASPFNDDNPDVGLAPLGPPSPGLGEKENVPVLTTPRAPSSQAPTAVPAGQKAVLQAKSQVQSRPRRVPFEESLLELSRTHMESQRTLESKRINLQAMEIFTKRRDQIMSRLDRELISKDEATILLAKVDQDEDNYSL